MRFMSMCIAGFAALTLAAPISALADENIGHRDYESKCASCHGVTGEGNGWFSKFLKAAPPSITRLKKNNGGVFPFERVYRVVDGRAEVLVHGPRDMPIWGSVYRVESDKTYDTRSGTYYADEEIIRARINALVGYVSQLQE
jgi:mono/diheme cytochrome c family protein